jgi:hypothetical protein
VNDPVASCFRFSEIEHAAMVAGPAAGSGVHKKKAEPRSRTGSATQYIDYITIEFNRNLSGRILLLEATASLHGASLNTVPQPAE